MIAYPITAARESKMFDRIVVSTEDAEIAAVARACGAETPFVRPSDLANDFANTDEVIAHALEFLAAQGKPATYACCIYATSPFLTAEDLRRGYEALRTRGRRYTFSVTSFPARIQRALRILPAGGIAPFFPQWIESRSQDLEDAYMDAGQFYWGEAEAFRQRLPFFEAHTEAIVLPRHRVQDIDTPEDWAQAELIYRALQRGSDHA